MPFTRMQEAATLATTIDTATNRRDEMGMDMLRDLLPELREVIDDVNAALLEVDELLFQGLRDEAVSLNDPEFSKLAARLNLEDKEAWPDVLAFFDREGIAPPPRIDFDTLAALESAHAELQTLGRPLDRLRQLVLHRAPLRERLLQLRKIAAADGTKPVWAETITDHERARMTELPDAVKRALSAKDPDAIAALHVELVDPEWSIPVPRELVRATRGADLWKRLREAVPAAEAAATGLEATFAEIAAGAHPDGAAALRQARQSWFEAAGAVHECRAGLAECSTLAALAREDGLDPRFDGLAEKTGPALALLEQWDMQEATQAHNAQALAQLEALVNHLPTASRGERPWLQNVNHLAQAIAAQGLMRPDLQARMAAAVAAVRQRPVRRMMVRAGIGAVTLCAAIVTLGAVRGCLRAQGERDGAVAMLKKELVAAKSGAYEVTPPSVMDAAEAYDDDKTVQQLVSDIEKSVDLEVTRRSTVESALAEHARLLDAADADLAARRAGANPLAPWPRAIEQAAGRWKIARAKGGTRALDWLKESANSQAQQRRTDEEARIGKAEERHRKVEARFDSIASIALQRRCADLSTRIDDQEASLSRQACATLRGEFDALKAAAKATKTATPASLLESTSESVVPPDRLGDLTMVETKLEGLEGMISKLPQQSAEGEPAQDEESEP